MHPELFPITTGVLAPAAPVILDLAALGLVVGVGAYFAARGIQTVRHEIGEALKI